MEEKLTSDHPLAVQSIDALAGLRSNQCVAVREGAKDIAKLPDTWTGDPPYPWSLNNLPLTTERALQLVIAAPDQLSELVQEPLRSGWLPFTSETPAPARFRLGNLLSTSEASQIGSKLLLLITRMLTTPKPGPEETNYHYGLWQLYATHHETGTQFYLSAELDESGQHKGPSRVRHRVEVFRSSIDDTDDAAYDELGVLSDEPSWLVDELKKKSQHLPIAYAELGNAFDDDLRVGPERTAVLLKWMTERLISSARLTAQRAAYA